ncbi:MAG: two-component regulator propeller domain-containing protein, partial [Bacteroidota bacterium]
MKKKHQLAIILLLLFSQWSTAQTFQEKYVKTEAITINDGLSQGMINCIFQDHFGFMWFGTNDGLNRFDGYKFTVFRYDANNPNSISGNLITSITEDSKGRLWIGTGLSGLNLFLMESESFIRFTNESTDNSISNNRILSVQEDPTGAIWAGTSSGLNKIVIEQKKEVAGVNDKDLPSNAFFKKNKVTFTHIYFDEDHSKECFLFYDETTNKGYFEPTFYIDKRGILWACTINGLYNIFTTANAVSHPVKLKEELYNIYPSTAGLEFVYNYLEDTIHHKLYLMKKGYIAIVDEKTNEITFHENSRPQFAFYRTQFIQNDGKIWSANYESVIQYDLSTRIAYTLRPKVVDQIRMMNHANTIFQDRSGLIWIGTKGYGILKYNPQSERFHEMALPSISWMTNLSDTSVLVIAQGKLMLLKENTSGKFELDTTFMSKLPKVEPFRRADIAVKKRRGDYFINSSKIYRVSEDLKTAGVISENYNGSFPLFIDKDDHLWFGGSFSFCRFDSETGVLKEYPYPVKKINLTPYKFLEYICQENEDEFWLGTVDGLFYFNRKTEKWKHYYNVPGDKNSLSIDLVFSIVLDPKYPEKYIWLGTNGGGLNCLNKETGRFIHFNV